MARQPRTMIGSRIRVVRDRFGRLAWHQGGLAAVEFALILPILVVLWIGGVEVTQALSVDRRLNNLAASIADLAARSKALEYSDVDRFFDLSEAVMYPFSDTGVGMRVSAVAMDGDGNASIDWSRSRGLTAYSDAEAMNALVPANLRVPDTQLIMAEVTYTYRPTVGYVITGDLALDDRAFFVPRQVAEVPLCDNSGNNCKPG